jgi:hypothetical protein
MKKQKSAATCHFCGAPITDHYFHATGIEGCGNIFWHNLCVELADPLSENSYYSFGRTTREIKLKSYGQ